MREGRDGEDMDDGEKDKYGGWGQKGGGLRERDRQRK